VRLGYVNLQSAQTWVWNGGWTRVDSGLGNAPPFADGAAMAYDPTSQHVIYFTDQEFDAGGRRIDKGETWSWMELPGRTWRQLASQAA